MQALLKGFIGKQGEHHNAQGCGHPRSFVPHQERGEQEDDSAL